MITARKLIPFIFLIFSANAYSLDSDGDSVDDAIDNCPDIQNANQLNSDSDSAGAACDYDEAFITLRPEILVNVDTYRAQGTPDVASFSDRSFIVVWEGYGDDSLYYDIYARIFDKEGTPLTDQFKINQRIDSYQHEPQVVIDSHDNFLIVWRTLIGSSDIAARKYTKDAIPLTDEIEVNTFKERSQFSPAVAISPEGEFIIIWESNGQDTTNWDVYMRRFDANGLPKSAETKVNTYPRGYTAGYWTGPQGPDIAIASAGNFIVVWSGEGMNGGQQGIYATRYDSTGDAINSNIKINSSPNNGQGYVSIAMKDNGDYVIAWSGEGNDDLNDIYARNFDANNIPNGNEYLVNTYINDKQWYPTISMNNDGMYIIAWQSFLQNDAWDIFAQRYNQAGERINNEFQVNDFTQSWQTFPSISMDEYGDFVATYQSYLVDGSQSGILLQRFGVDSDRDGILDADEEDCYPGKSYNSDINGRGYINGLNHVQGLGHGLLDRDTCR